MHKVFISYHHANDQWHKEALVEFGKRHGIFVDWSVDTGDIPDDWSTEKIRRTIRDDYLRDSTVTILLVGEETLGRKYVDWELYSSMHDGTVNKKSGIVVINLPGVAVAQCTAAYGAEEKRILYPDITSWTSVDSRAEYERRYPHMPDRIIDNLLKPKAKVSVTSWDRLQRPGALEFLIHAAFRNRANCEYDLSRPLRRANSKSAESLYERVLRR